MSEVTITQFAEVVKIPADRLLGQLAKAGIDKSSVDDVITESEKMNLLSFLKESHGDANGKSSKGKIVLKRKSTSTLKIGGGRASGKSVNVEVRKKRTITRAAAKAPAGELADSDILVAKQAIDERRAAENKQQEQDDSRRKHQLKKHKDEERAKEALSVLRKERFKDDIHVFTFRGRRIKQANTKAFRAGLKRAGIENFRWHDLRHTFASWHIQNGTPLHILTELGGWSSDEMVKRYAHLSADHLMEFASNIEPALDCATNLAHEQDGIFGTHR